MILEPRLLDARCCSVVNFGCLRNALSQTVSSSMAVVQVWDSNALQAACTFSLPVQVNTVAMSACQASHCLVAVGAADTEVRLCDPQSGSFSHILQGHRSKVWAVCWSLQSEWELMTGGCDGQVRLRSRTPT